MLAKLLFDLGLHLAGVDCVKGGAWAFTFELKQYVHEDDVAFPLPSNISFFVTLLLLFNILLTLILLFYLIGPPPPRLTDIEFWAHGITLYLPVLALDADHHVVRLPPFEEKFILRKCELNLLDVVLTSCTQVCEIIWRGSLLYTGVAIFSFRSRWCELRSPHFLLTRRYRCPTSIWRW